MRQYENFLLRVPPLMYTWLSIQAAKNKRSVNCEINFALETYKIEWELKNGK